MLRRLKDLARFARHRGMSLRMRTGGHRNAGVPEVVSMNAKEIIDRVEAHLRVERSGSLLSLDDYAELLSRIADTKRFRSVCARDFPSTTSDDQVVYTIRHDVDLDLPICGPMARLEAKHQVHATFYILHTSETYYGRWNADGEFCRYEGLCELISRISQSGMEVGLHIDPFGLEAAQRVDGVSAMADELVFLREQGLDVTAVCAHNSQSVFNADNKDVFAGENATDLDRVDLDDGRSIALGTVTRQELGIDTIADYNRTIGYTLLEQPHVSPMGCRIDRTVRYELAYDVGFSLLLNGQWELNGNNTFLGESSFHNDELRRVLDLVPRGWRVLFNIHPMYYGADRSAIR